MNDYKGPRFIFTLHALSQPICTQLPFPGSSVPIELLSVSCPCPAGVWEYEGWVAPFSLRFPQGNSQSNVCTCCRKVINISRATQLNTQFLSVEWKTNAFVKAFPHHPQRPHLITKSPKPHLASHICCSAWCCPICAWRQRQRDLCGKRNQRSQPPLPRLHLCKGNTKCLRFLTHFGLKCAALDGNSRCGGRFGALVFGMLASAVIRAIRAGFLQNQILHLCASGHGKTIHWAKTPVILHSV